MKILSQFTFFLAVFSLICSPSYAQDSLEINVTIFFYGIEEPLDTLFLSDHPNTSGEKFSKIKIPTNKDGSFNFKGHIAYPRELVLANRKSVISFFVDTAPVSVFVASNDLTKSLISGSWQEEILQRFTHDRQNASRYQEDLYQIYDTKLGNKPLEEYSSEHKKKLNRQIDSLLGREKKAVLIDAYSKMYRAYPEQMFLKYVRLYPGSYASALALDSYSITRENLDDMIEHKHEIVSGATHFSNDMLRNPVVNQYIRTVNSMGKHKVGDLFPNISLEDTSGIVHSVSEKLKHSEYLLVDFWASWCGPCIQKMNEIRDYYPSMDRKRFEVLTISIDKERDAWLRAIGEHRYPWVEVWSSPQGPQLSDFFIPTIPLNYLLGEDGRIVKINASIDELKDFLK
ncbi:peroxiredoxin family protein [Sphingobacterium deserti]|uniref:Alkyl hydroperoxide reductase/thiol specific antioxidant/Mal allergen n=1 Tax=Sphingobacterium deserti TaxID=1229276 RepID=A0A0B8T308_9SPHI|nr:TlpA disulfide reductase family protein [Sphingobacterium deserti]KGE13333.1 alkyl hydroperoxide reductase/thiol specific antioxidant/Mal allergen [Sphingobacterium deserti]